MKYLFNLKKESFIWVFSLCIFSSCNFFDPASFFCSSSVNERFDQRLDYDDFSAPNVVDPNNYKFVVISDPHYYEEQPNYIKTLAEHHSTYNFEFIFVLGDIAQAGTDSQYTMAKEDFSHSPVPIFPLLGNHDIYNQGFDQFATNFGRSIYNFSFGNSGFIVLDTGNGTLGSKQKDWYEEILSGNTWDNLFVFSHYSLTDNPFQRPTAKPYPEEAYWIMDLNKRYNVDIFFTGHLHHYDIKTIRGVIYCTVNNSVKDEDSAVLVHVNGTKINYEPLSGVLKAQP